MKIVSILVSLLLSLCSYSALAFDEGTYTCGSRADFHEAIYKITTLTVNGVSLPYLEITNNYYKKPTDPNSKNHTYQAKGIANHFIDDEVSEFLILGHFTLKLTNGKIICKANSSDL